MGKGLVSCVLISPVGFPVISSMSLVAAILRSEETAGVVRPIMTILSVLLIPVVADLADALSAQDGGNITCFAGYPGAVVGSPAIPAPAMVVQVILPRVDKVVGGADGDVEPNCRGVDEARCLGYDDLRRLCVDRNRRGRRCRLHHDRRPQVDVYVDAGNCGSCGGDKQGQ